VKKIGRPIQGPESEVRPARKGFVRIGPEERGKNQRDRGRKKKKKTERGKSAQLSGGLQFRWGEPKIFFQLEKKKGGTFRAQGGGKTKGLGIVSATS